MQEKEVATVLVAGTGSGSGKTTVTTGVLSWLVTEGYRVQSYKLGPDYIDSGHHAMVTGRPCINLDGYLLAEPGHPIGLSGHSGQQIKDEFLSAIGDAEVLVIEAVGGIFDDWHKDENSAAEIAKLLGVSVLLVLDARASCQSAGIMANGLMSHDEDLDLLGIVFTKVNRARHFESIQDGIADEFKSKAHCFLPYHKELHTEERHLGLLQAEEVASESEGSRTQVVADIFGKFLPFERIIANKQKFHVEEKSKVVSDKCCRFAIARDKAFSFYYEYNLRALQDAGAELVYFSPLEDSHLPEDIAGIYFGGGYPELHAEQLAANASLREEIKEMANQGMPIYAECGGLMYLGSEIQQHDTDSFYSGVGVFPYRTFFSSKLFLGYVEVEMTSDCLLGDMGTKVRGHVFHRSDIDSYEEVETVASIHHKTKKITQKEGYRHENVYASYAHLHFKSSPEIPVNVIRKASEWQRMRHSHLL